MPPGSQQLSVTLRWCNELRQGWFGAGGFLEVIGRRLPNLHKCLSHKAFLRFSQAAHRSGQQDHTTSPYV